MAQQRSSRKRQRGSGAAGEAAGALADTPALGGEGAAAAAARAEADAAPTPPAGDAVPARGRRGRRADGPPLPTHGPDGRRLSRSEARDAAARAQLVPLAPGERPRAVTIAAVVAVVLAALVVIGYASGARVGGEGSLFGALLLMGILLVAAWGMWTVRYWAVLGFEALLGFQIAIAALSLLVASNWWAALLCVVVIGLAGWLFWKLIRAMARIQMPERPSAS